MAAAAFLAVISPASATRTPRFRRRLSQQPRRSVAHAADPTSSRSGKRESPLLRPSAVSAFATAAKGDVARDDREGGPRSVDVELYDTTLRDGSQQVRARRVQALTRN